MSIGDGLVTDFDRRRKSEWPSSNDLFIPGGSV